MKQTVFEQMNGTYTQQGDYLIPCLMFRLFTTQEGSRASISRI